MLQALELDFLDSSPNPMVGEIWWVEIPNKLSFRHEHLFASVPRGLLPLLLDAINPTQTQRPMLLDSGRGGFPINRYRPDEQLFSHSRFNCKHRPQAPS